MINNNVIVCILTLSSPNQTLIILNNGSLSDFDNLLNIQFIHPATNLLQEGSESFINRAPNVIRNVPLYSFNTFCNCENYTKLKYLKNETYHRKRIYECLNHFYRRFSSSLCFVFQLS